MFSQAVSAPPVYSSALAATNEVCALQTSEFSAAPLRVSVPIYQLRTGVKTAAPAAKVEKFCKEF